MDKKQALLSLETASLTKQIYTALFIKKMVAQMKSTPVQITGTFNQRISDQSCEDFLKNLI